jgi:hypothetical protein
MLNYNLSPKLQGPHFPKQQLIVRNRMESKMSKFEVKNFDTDNWQWVSEIAVLGILQKTFEQITPKITEMLPLIRCDINFCENTTKIANLVV